MGRNKVLAGGVFNVIHPGHCHFLREARKLGDELVVIVAHDSTVVRRGKKPLFPAEARASMVASLEFVDRAIVGDERDMMKAVREEKPDIIALGYDQDMDDLRESLSSAGIECKIVRIGELPGFSTRGITGG